MSACGTGQYFRCSIIATLYGLQMVTSFDLFKLRVLYAMCGLLNTRIVLVDCCILIGCPCRPCGELFPVDLDLVLCELGCIMFLLMVSKQICIFGNGVSPCLIPVP
jgi:hypothetical protein